MGRHAPRVPVLNQVESLRIGRDREPAVLHKASLLSSLGRQLLVELS